MKRFLIVSVAAFIAWSVLLAAPSSPPTPAAAQASRDFDVQKATDAWLNTFSPEQRAKSDAYFGGSCWLMLWDFLATTIAMLILLETKLSARLRDLSVRMTRIRALQFWLYWAGFISSTALLMLPLTIYEGFFRERSYALMNQTFRAWFRDQFVAFAVVGLLAGGIAYLVLMATVRALPRTWHLWGTGVAVLLVSFGTLIEPVFIAPLFNTYKPLENARLKSQILSLAKASGIEASEVYEVDASLQSKRVSAFVSGFGSTERITLNDNLLNRVSPEGVLSVMGHEMGHYVMHHILNGILFSAILIFVLLTVLRWAVAKGLGRWGERWQASAITDVASLPFAVLVLTALSLVLTPLTNTFTRTQEYEADLYGLNAARQPDGEAEVDVLLGEYRKLSPGPLEEFLFYDHPSGRTRIRAAMRWKAENLCLADASLPCGDQMTKITASPTVPSALSAAPHQ